MNHYWQSLHRMGSDCWLMVKNHDQMLWSVVNHYLPTTRSTHYKATTINTITYPYQSFSATFLLSGGGNGHYPWRWWHGPWGCFLCQPQAVSSVIATSVSWFWARWKISMHVVPWGLLSVKLTWKWTIHHLWQVSQGFLIKYSNFALPGQFARVYHSFLKIEDIDA